MGRPACRIAAGGMQHLPSNHTDQADFLGDRNELARLDDAALGMVPAQQRLAADNLGGIEIDQRLIVHDQLAMLYRAAEIRFELAAGLDRDIHALLEATPDA